MQPLWQFLILLAIHWVGDFVLQTHWQATNKSKRWDALAWHVLTYTAVLGIAMLLIFPGGTWLVWFVFVGGNGLLHFATDAVTSRVNARLWAKGDVHNFFAAVGFDQLIHQTTLAVTMWLAFYS